MLSNLAALGRRAGPRDRYARDVTASPFEPAVAGIRSPRSADKNAPERWMCAITRYITSAHAEAARN